MKLLSETTLNVQQVADMLPGVSCDAIRAWMRTGFRGWKLEAIRAGGQWITSKEALGRFLSRVNDPYLADGPEGELAADQSWSEKPVQVIELDTPDAGGE